GSTSSATIQSLTGGSSSGRKQSSRAGSSAREAVHKPAAAAARQSESPRSGRNRFGSGASAQPTTTSSAVRPSSRSQRENSWPSRNDSEIQITAAPPHDPRGDAGEWPNQSISAPRVASTPIASCRTTPPLPPAQ